MLNFEPLFGDTVLIRGGVGWGGGFSGFKEEVNNVKSLGTEGRWTTDT